MTSEGPHRPGQEPDEVPPGGGGPAPYGDRPAQQDNGYGAPAPDLGWAPPPPARPDASTPGWANQQGAAWSNAQATRQAEPPTPGNWEQPAANRPSWLAQEDQSQQPAQGWAPAAPSTSEQPSWANGAQTSPAWATEPAPADAGKPAEWTPNQPASGQPDWATSKPTSGQPGGWGGGQQPEWTPAPRNDDQAPGWATPAGQPESPQPDWAHVEPPMPVRNEPAARATAQVPQADPALPHRPGTESAAGADAWQAEQQEQPGWATGQRREPAVNGWAPEQQPAEGRQTSGDRPAQPDWATPASGEPTGWAGGNPAAGPPPTWSPNAEPLPSRSAADRSLPDIEPWSAGEAWGRAGAAETTPPRAEAEPEAARAEEVPVYQPAPAPGISPANMVPLPPQEQRVPGASLGGAPPTDYGQPPSFTDDQAGQGARPGTDQAAGATGWGQPESRHDEPQPPAGPVIPAPRISPEAEGRPTPPTGGGVTASASVPVASRVMPPADHPLGPTGSVAPQPRVYGRPARSEQAEEPPQERDEQPLVPRFDQGPERFDEGPEPRFNEPQPPAGGRDAFAGPAAPASLAAPPAFPPGVPSFVDAPPTNRPLNGVRPHAEPERPADPYGGPGNDPPARPGGTYGAPARPEAGAEHNSAFPPPPQSAPPWSPGPSSTEPEQGRFDAFKPVAEPAAEAPVPKVRNGRVLAAVLVAAVLILAIPLGLLMLLGMVGESNETNAFDPPVGSCVKRSGDSAVAAECTEVEAFTVVSKVESKDKCPDPVMPHVDLRGASANPVLCLKQATGG
ncbi:hypothetical protein [Micromonospora sp. LOL_024]|uniref:hypothetical protein n=1 Tax=Micromonospora sp. LOL_024 TaxID=3345412 RepID=UPI003A8A266A